jgi:hypothetical protein
MPFCLVTCPVKSLLKRVQEENVLSTFLTRVGVMVVKWEVVQTSLVRKQGKDSAGKITVVDTVLVSSKCNE